MLDVFYSAQFKRDYKLMGKQGRNLNLLLDVIDTLATEQQLDQKYKDHPLSGNFVGYRECHVLSDWLLIYKLEKDRLVLTVTRTGTHSELFDK
jgi:mRNA interferase YafQ